MEYSGLGIGLHYVHQLIPDLCELWNLREVYDRYSRCKPASVLGEVVNQMMISLSSNSLTGDMDGILESQLILVDRRIVMSIDCVMDVLDKLMVMFVYRTQYRSAYDSVYGHVLSPKWDPSHQPKDQEARVRRGVRAITVLQLRMMDMVIWLIKQQPVSMKGGNGVSVETVKVGKRWCMIQGWERARCRWVMFVCQVSQYLTEHSIMETESCPALSVGVKTCPREVKTKEFVFQGDKVFTHAARVWSGGISDVPSSSTSLAIRRYVVRQVVDHTWMTWAHTCRLDQPILRLGHPWRHTNVVPM